MIYHRVFVKHFKQRLGSDWNLLSRYEERFQVFLRDRNDRLIKDHSLTGKLKGKRAFWVAGDLRVVYREKKPGIIEFMDIGSHNQVYR
ncbi:hypothetical protein A2W24_02390 [Microgenomates group bacterium RBG_16_45_19]|nr:MAG: hypothetical protein A2W24_02390 [Microgenomates group bacterium RBG_16_45_19]